MKKKVLVAGVLLLVGLAVGLILSQQFTSQPATADKLKLEEQEATVRVIKQALPAVVSIIIYDQETVLNLTPDGGSVSSKKVVKGSGTGFLISADGLILTNKHVVMAGQEKTVEYKVVLNSKKEYYAQLIGKDPLHDLAVLKIFDKNLPYLQMGSSTESPIGATVLAIGNVLGRYENSVTKGIVSGLGRNLLAADPNGGLEALDNILQTDAQINEGNSGGPLINLDGKVVGINVAVDKGGYGLGFAIPIDDARSVVDSVRRTGRIIRVRLGVRYQTVNVSLATEKKLNRDYGALVSADELGQPAVVPDSPAAKAGLQEGDIIYEVNAIKIDGTNSLLAVIQRYQPGNRVGLKIQRGKEIINKVVVLDEFK